MKRKRETAWLLCLAMLVPSVCASEATPPEAAKEPPVQSADLTKEEEEKLRELDAQAEENAADYQKLMEIEAQRGPLDEELLALYEKWEELNG